MIQYKYKIQSTNLLGRIAMNKRELFSAAIAVVLLLLFQKLVASNNRGKHRKD
jgi:hypothetical protein